MEIKTEVATLAQRDDRGEDITVIQFRPAQRKQAAFESRHSILEQSGRSRNFSSGFENGIEDPSSNGLIESASELLAFAKRIRNSSHYADPAGLHRRLLDELHRFDQVARRFGSYSEPVSMATLWLCALLDDAVMRTPWGGQCDWHNHRLLYQFYRQPASGLPVADILENSLRKHLNYPLLLEFCYVCLSVGFAGHHRDNVAKSSRVEELRTKLFNNICTRHPPASDLCEHWRGLGSAGHSHRVPFAIVVIAIALALGAFYMAGNKWADHKSEPVLRHLRALSEGDRQPAFS